MFEQFLSSVLLMQLPAGWAAAAGLGLLGKEERRDSWLPGASVQVFSQN